MWVGIGEQKVNLSSLPFFVNLNQLFGVQTKILIKERNSVNYPCNETIIKLAPLIRSNISTSHFR